ncbi:MAG: hypothetical protein A2083_03350 [Gemmatimonadetes bacterium GWC2_71_9]|nr:MAG: hypothetical protein A2083_03350 [Gemmatimonadetes bacterium GWC2_71_9]OGT96616.1 MAG: hypothetical protein A3I79_02080 [Gemmatimonadetes bacterium RIFCSPLOWO2_02_FULL_71_11]
MRSLMTRLFALAVLVAQLQAVPAARACAREHGRQTASPCDQSHKTTGPAVAPAQDAGGLCGVLGPCALTSPVVFPTAVVSDFGGQYLHLVVQGAASAPASFDAAPIPPPPQA